VSVYCSQVT